MNPGEKSDVPGTIAIRRIVEEFTDVKVIYPVHLKCNPQVRKIADPYNYLNEDGVPTGIDVELATEAFKRMGYQVKVVQINWEEKKELVESGEIDCIMGCFSMEGRLDDYRWAGPYIASRQVVAVNESSDIYKLSDLEGKNLAVQSTTKPEGIFLNRTDERIPNWEI